MSLYIVHITNYLLPLITIPYLVRVLSPSGFGQGVFAQSFASFFNILVDFGFVLTATRDIATKRTDKQAVSSIVSNVFYTKLCLLVVSFFIFLIAKPFIVGEKASSSLLWFAFLGVIAQTLFPNWLYQGLEELTFLSKINFSVKLLQLPLFLIFVRNRDDAWKWLALVATVNFAAAIVIWFDAYIRLKIKITRPSIRRIKDELYKGVNVFISQAATSLYTMGNSFILGLLTSPSVVGYYGAAERLIKVIFGLLSPLSQALFPRASKLASDSHEDAIKLTQKVSIIMGSLGFMLSACTLVLADFVTPLVLGKEFIQAIPILKVLSPVPFLVALSNVLGIQIMIPFRFDKPFSIILVGAGIFDIIAAIILVARWQAIGMALAFSLTEFLVTMSMYIFLCRKSIYIFKLDGLRLLTGRNNV